MKTREVSIPCGAILLEGVLEIPDNGQMPAPGAVICHPHPLYGGTKDNNVVRALAQAMLSRGEIALRFNFRGTGRSQGTHGDGIDEVDDVRAALDFLDRTEEVDPNRIVLAGYSFGCWVGLKAAVDDLRPGRLIGISPPVDHWDFGFLRNEQLPILLLAGDRDFVCSQERFRDLLRIVPEPKVGKTLEGADHFHFGRENQLMRETIDFLDRYPW